MKDPNEINKYMEVIRHEIGALEDHFTGSITFEINLRDDGIGNVNVKKAKSIRLSNGY